MRNSEELKFGKGIKVSRRLTCGSIPKKKKQELHEKGIEVVEAKFMLEKLLDLVKGKKGKKRKGVHREPLLWLLQTLNNMGKIHR